MISPGSWIKGWQFWPHAEYYLPNAASIKEFGGMSDDRSVATLLAEDLGGEGFNGCASLPGIRRQSGFAAGLLDKSCAVPGALDGNLGQQQAAASTPAN